MYYMNDGVYGSFASKLSEDLNTIPEVHKASFFFFLSKCFWQFQNKPKNQACWVAEWVRH